MKIINFSIFLIIIINISYINCYGVLDSLEDYITDILNKFYIKPFLNIISPKHYIKSMNRAGADVVRKLASSIGAGDEVLNVANSKVPEIIIYHGYPVETHHIHTGDGYVLQIHRIPYERTENVNIKRGVVILGHGLLCSSACWIFLGPERALPYILADLGYDVWLLNYRGNTYGREHVRSNPDNRKFWNFSFHEMGIYDLPAVIDYVTNTTQEKQVFFVGHSLSTTVFYVMCSVKPEYNEKIRAHISLAPMAYLKHIKNRLLYVLSKFVSLWDKLSRRWGYEEFLPDSQFLVRVGGLLCTMKPFGEWLCKNALFVICGFNKNELNATLIPIIFGHTPAGTSVRVLVHYGQLINNFIERFQYFSHGLANTFIYKTIFPPQYNLKNVVAPTYCFYALNDWIVNKIDARKTCNELGNLQMLREIDNEQWTHNDFIYAISAKETIYNDIVDILDKHIEL